MSEVNLEKKDKAADVLPEQSGNAEVTEKKKKPVALIIVLCIIVILLILLAAGYFQGMNYYKNHFLPNTTVNNIVCDNLTAEEVAAMLEAQKLDYSLTVTGRDGAVLGTLTAEDIDKKYVSMLDGVQGALESQDEMTWFLSYFGKRRQGHDILCGTQYDAEMAVLKLQEWSALDEKQMEAPQDAYLSEYRSEIKGYEIVPETAGTTLDVEKVTQLVLEALDMDETQLDLEEKDCYLQAEITADDKILNRLCEELNRMTGTCITYDWNGNEVILDGDTIQEWIILEDEETGTFSLDEEAVAEFVAEQAKKYDTYGKHRKFTTTLGETITVLNGGYGWKTDREAETEELIALIKEGAVTEKEPEYRVTAMQKGENDIGSSYVEIDLTNQHLYLYWKGELVLETDFVSGDVSQGNTTPGGLYRLTYKTKDAVLRGADYVTPVKYWMPFNGNIGMHDATWRYSFGGDIYLTNGSHGCVNLPLDKAEAIYAYVSTGFPIICYYY